MTTALGAFASSMIRVLTFAFFMLVAFIIALVLAAGAMAQDVVAVAPTGPAPSGGSWQASITLARDTAVAMILAVIAGVVSWGSQHAPAWVKATLDRLTTSEAIEWDDYVRTALNGAFDVAIAKVGPPEALTSLKDKNEFTSWAIGTLNRFNRDIVDYLDKDGNGVIDLIDAELAKRGIAPKLLQPPIDPFVEDLAKADAEAEASKLQAPMGLAGNSQSSRRVQRATKTPAEMASMFPPRRGGKGAH